MPTWKEVTAANPSHSESYARRWKRMEEQGHDINGEARLIDAIAPRDARILDAGCGQGRVGGYLAEQGHTVVGTDIDEILIDYAQKLYPDSAWYVGDLSKDPIPEGNFDIAVSAGNVMGFLDPNGRREALQHVYDALRGDGRFVVGFGAGRGWDFPDFIALTKDVGFNVEILFESWDLAPFDEESTFLVAFLRKPALSVDEQTLLGNMRN
ncbi:class I SAM-dependent methyltransferase [Corynebacterium breve]|uniref:Class I SAM-dependent methyltransferase n=1 Tax=Corynebacterium breve TaxID=3049799 RepID=A0ABY8VH29_9CORY|nr:class I SAM-dependent methyltransferase [Corynebacterium breve]WIM68818.1 class I SAM-dependent methyltransferase [Corynebacterium breve]